MITVTDLGTLGSIFFQHLEQRNDVMPISTHFGQIYQFMFSCVTYDSGKATFSRMEATNLKHWPQIKVEKHDDDDDDDEHQLYKNETSL